MQIARERTAAIPSENLHMENKIGNFRIWKPRARRVDPSMK